MKSNKSLFATASLLMALAAQSNAAVVDYTTTAETYTNQSVQNGSSNYAGAYDNTGDGSAYGNIDLAQYANGSGSPTPQVVSFEQFNTTGASGGTARALQVGDTFSITCYVANSSSFWSGGSIGIAFNNSTNFSSVGNYNTNLGAKVELDQNGDWYGGNGTSTFSPGSSAAAGSDQTFSITITSANTFNMTIAGTTYYDQAMGSTGPITSMAIWDFGSTNNTFWKNATLQDTGSVTLGGANDTSTISGSISDGLAANSTSSVTSNSLVKNGTGTITLTAANNYTGSTTINSGTLKLGSGGTAGSIDSTSGVIFGSGVGNTLAINRSDSPTLAYGIQTGGQANIYSTGTVTLSGPITGSGEFWTTGPGTVVIADNAGSTTGTSAVVLNGTLSVSDFTTSTLGTDKFFVVSGTLQYTGASTSTTRLGNYGLQSASSGIAVTNAGTNLTISNDLGGFTGGGLTKSGAGTLTLGATTNTYNGATTVSAGTLIVGGSLTATSSVNVSSGANLEVTGGIQNSAGVTINGVLSGGGSVGAVTVNAGGTLSPGVGGSGNLTLSSLSFSSGASLALTINGNNNSTNVTNSDTGGVNITGVNLNLTTTYSPSKTGLLSTSDKVVITLGGGTITGQFANTSTVTGDPYYGTVSNVVTDNNGNEWAVFTNTNGLGAYAAGDIELVAVPEPNTWAMALSGFGVLLTFQRMRKNRAGAR